MASDARHTHAGAVVFRERAGQREYLVVASSDGSSWVLPKGHIERGESPEEAARREVLEEAGVTCEVVRFLATLPIAAKRASVAFFLARATGEGKATEEREKRWLESGEAEALLTFADTRRLLRQAIE